MPMMAREVTYIKQDKPEGEILPAFFVITKGANSAEILSYMYIDRRIFRVAFRVAFSPKIVLFDIKS